MVYADSLQRQAACDGGNCRRGFVTLKDCWRTNIKRMLGGLQGTKLRAKRGRGSNTVYDSTALTLLVRLPPHTAATIKWKGLANG